MAIESKTRTKRKPANRLLAGKPVSEVVAGVGDSGRPGSTIPATGAFVFRDREKLYNRISEARNVSLSAV
jgi:hypothetical protein